MPELSLRGCRILLVEDEYMLASELGDELESVGAIVLGPAATVQDGLDCIHAEPEIDGAIVDVNLRGQMAFPVADLLMERHVPLVFTTGYDEETLPLRFSKIPRFDKPIDLARIAQAIGRALHA